jgi:serine/threonine protein kinase
VVDVYATVTSVDVVGSVLDGKYEISRVLGVGGMGTVYEGRNLRIQRRVAIKVLHSSTAASAESVARFEQEARAAGRIGSPHVVEVIDLGHLPNGDLYLVMEFLEGESLAQRFARTPRAHPGQLAPIIHQLLEGLAAAHDVGIVHRDLKPENVFLQRTKDGDFVKLLDFGISKFTKDRDISMTQTGSIVGTPYYMAPEHVRGAPIDHRVDLYAVGVILYEGLSGRLPYQGDVLPELVFKIALEDPPPLAGLRPDLPSGWIQLVQRAMARQLDARFASAREFQHALSQLSTAPRSIPTPGATLLLDHGTARTWATPRPEDSRPAGSRAGVVLGALAAAAVVLGGGAFFGYRALHRAPPVAASVTTASGPLLAAPAPPSVEPVTVPTLAAAPAFPSTPAEPPSELPEPPPAHIGNPAHGQHVARPPASSASPAASASAEATEPRTPRKLRRKLE